MKPSTDKGQVMDLNLQASLAKFGLFKHAQVAILNIKNGHDLEVGQAISLCLMSGCALESMLQKPFY